MANVTFEGVYQQSDFLVHSLYLPLADGGRSFYPMTISAPDGEEEGKKEICSKFDNIIISCVQGICKNVSEVYDCTYESNLKDLENDRGGRGECHCAQCGPEEKKVRINNIDRKSDWRWPNDTRPYRSEVSETKSVLCL